MLKQPVDIDKLRKKRRRNYRLRQLLFLFIILFFILAALYVNDVLVKKNVPGFLENVVEVVGGDGYPAQLPDGAIQHLDHMGKNLIVLKDSNLYIYNNKGKQIENIQQMKERTILQTNDDQMLYYNIGGNQIQVQGISGKVLDETLEDTIITAHLGDNGELAVVTWPPNFVAEIVVYNTRGEPFYTSVFTEKLVNHVAVSTKGQQLAVATLGTDGGILDSKILLYPLDVEEENPPQIHLPDELVLWIDYLQEDTLLILTDKGYHVYGNDTQLVGSYEFSSDLELLEYRERDGKLLLLGRDKVTRLFHVFFLSDTATERGELVLEHRPLDLAMSGKSVYILDSNGLRRYDHQLMYQEVFQLADIERIHIIGETVYLLTKNEIRLLDKNTGV